MDNADLENFKNKFGAGLPPSNNWLRASMTGVSFGMAWVRYSASAVIGVPFC